MIQIIPMTQEELKRILEYNPDTGIFTWKVHRGSRAIAGTVARSLDGRGHIRIRINRKHYAAHRLAFLYMTGSFPKELTDHVNCCRTDNRWCNLREATSIQNGHNSSIHKNNKIGLKGVSKNRKGWMARVTCQRKSYHLGTFPLPELAYSAANAMRVKLHGEYARHR